MLSPAYLKRRFWRAGSPTSSPPVIGILEFGVDNVFDRKAPYIQSFTDANTDTMTYDLLGRRFYVGFRTAF